MKTKTVWLLAIFLCLVTPALPQSTKSKHPASSATAAPATATVDLNTATESELEKLPGVGPATAKKIIAGRPYADISDLKRAGVTQHTIDKIAPLVTAGSAQSPQSRTTPKQEPSAPAGPPNRSSERPSGRQPGPPASSSAATATPNAPPAPGMVWVNTDTKVFHREGDRWYGKTQHGRYMTEEEAIRAGYHESKKK